MASTAGEARSTGFGALKARGDSYVHRLLCSAEIWLESERGQLPLWLPVMLGVGVALWFVLPLTSMWVAVILAGMAIAFAGLSVGRQRRVGLALMLAGTAISAGCALVWARSNLVAAPVITRPMVAQVSGEIVKAEKLESKGNWRLTVATEGLEGVPPRVRISVPIGDLRRDPQAGDTFSARVRLMPPTPAAVPGAYDFRRQAWFKELGAVGKSLGPVQISGVSDAPGLRQRLNAHISNSLDDQTSGIASALATGDQGRISEEDQEAMRASGLAHLLSVSGLHISAVVAAAFFLSLRVLALSPRLALYWPLLAISAGFAALTGIGYTLLTGAEVPTIRSCIAAILVLIGMVLGREAMTLRLVATGALVVLLLWPESLVGPSFQLSFAAITAIVALHESKRVQAWFSAREEALLRSWGRALASLLLTGLVVEVALAPIALFHFHKSGLYGALANLVAIPMTTFVIMPAEALALLADVVGLGAPFWWVTGKAIAALLWLAHLVANQPGAVAMLPSVPVFAYGLMIGGGLWIMLWRTKMRFAGFLPLIAGALITLAAPSPDLLVTDDGRHLAVRDDAGRLAILRPKSGDFVRQVLAERSAYSGELDDLDVARHADCSPDACVIRMERGGRQWTVLAIRSRHMIGWKNLVTQCRQSDIIVSERWLPRACLARWLTIDPRMLSKTGGLAISLDPPRIETVRLARDDHPWMVVPNGPQ